jgi:hypothetical protein
MLEVSARSMPVLVYADEALELMLLPHAANNEPMAVAERPKMLARTNNSRRVMRPFRTSSTRCWPNSLEN